MLRVPAFSVLLLAAALPATGVFASHVQTDGGKSVSFTHDGGNEWWVEVELGGPDAATVAGVEARDDGGSWKTLTKRDWGPWAASFHVEPGHRVWFRASWSDGSILYSCGFTHPEGEETCGEPPAPTPDAVFDHRGGNEWWVEVDVDADVAPDTVYARDEGGEWRLLEKKSWGVWAGSFRIEPGHRVQFRAVAYGSMSDVYDETSCWFTHPEGVEQCDDAPPADGSFDATFSPKPGNKWWVETRVEANEPLAAVHARIVGEEWHALEKKSWGSWAASFHVPDGSHVEFRATSTDGDTDLSGRYVWPGATPVDETTWPREGSYLRYLLDSGESVGGWSESTVLWMNLTYGAGAWTGTCEGWRTEGYDGNDTRTRLEYTPSLPPPRGPEEVELGERVSAELPSCSPDGSGPRASTTAYVQERTTAKRYHYHERHLKDGEPVDVPVWHATYTEDGCPCQWRSVSWHPDTGLTINHEISYRYSYTSGHLVDTDAPIAPEDTAEPPRPAWPTEGSYVEYQVNRTSEYDDAVDQRQVRFEYVGGAWQVTCAGRDETSAQAPPMAPTTTEPGAHVRPTEASACYVTPPAVVVRGQFPHDTTREGQPHRATVWWGDEFDDTYGDEDAWWDVKTGLLLEWEDHGGYYRGDEGWLTDTDAPLSSR